MGKSKVIHDFHCPGAADTSYLQVVQGLATALLSANAVPVYPLMRTTITLQFEELMVACFVMKLIVLSGSDHFIRFSKVINISDFVAPLRKGSLQDTVEKSVSLSLNMSKQAKTRGGRSVDLSDQ